MKKHVLVLFHLAAPKGAVVGLSGAREPGHERRWRRFNRILLGSAALLCGVLFAFIVAREHIYGTAGVRERARPAMPVTVPPAERAGWNTSVADRVDAALVGALRDASIRDPAFVWLHPR